MEALRELQTRYCDADANESTVQQLKEANERMRKQLQQCHGFKQKIVNLEQANASLKEELKEAKKEARSSGRQRSVVPISKAPPGRKPTGTTAKIGTSASSLGDDFCRMTE